MADMRVILIRPHEDGSKLTLTLQKMGDEIEDDFLPEDGRRGEKREVTSAIINKNQATAMVKWETHDFQKVRKQFVSVRVRLAVDNPFF